MLSLGIPGSSTSAIMFGALTIHGLVPGQRLFVDHGEIVYTFISVSYTHLDVYKRQPFKDYPREIQDVILYGTGGKEVKVRYKSQRGEGVYDVAFEGLVENVNRRYKETFSEASKAEYETYMRITPCPACKGQRLKKESLAVTVGDMNIYQATNMSIVKFKDFLDGLKLTHMQLAIGASILKEIRARICFLIDVGLDSLSLSRATGTLSGGEAQRLRLATQIGSGLVGVAYILDEPSIGLHQRDNDKLLKTLVHLRDLGNSVLVVEHDEDTMRAADCIVDKMCIRDSWNTNETLFTLMMNYVAMQVITYCIIFWENPKAVSYTHRLLTEMDGFDGKKGVVILAATNRPESLDKALLRPGRFDRRVPVELPDLKGREAILRVHGRNVKMSDDVDYSAIARATAGASGAELANIINEAALRAVRMGRGAVVQGDLEESVETVIAGYQKKNAILSDQEKKTVAYHEIGHALVAALQSHSAPCLLYTSRCV